MTDPILSPTTTDIPDERLDVALTALSIGLKPVRAWITDTKPRASSSGAERTRRSREKSERDGLKQISITLPTELHPLVKALAARTKAGEAPAAVLRDLMGKLQPTPTVDVQRQLPVWRRWLLRCIVPAELLLKLQSNEPTPMN
jgi:hypothetical protein